MLSRSSSRLATLLLSVVVSVLVVVAMDMQARACTAVFVSAGGAVLVGNNEDASMPLSKVWVVPGEGGKYSRLCIGYAGDTTVQGGVNEKGLWLDSFSVDAKPVAASPGQKVFDGDMHDKIMAECATVEEAVALLRRYSNPFLSDNMLMLGDRTGASAIVEGSAVLPRRGPYQIITNFRQSEHPDGSRVCDRYRIAEAMLKADPHVTVDGIRKILAAVHQEGRVPTIYSYICDLRSMKLYLYDFHNFENVVVLDVQQELAKGRRSQSLPELFPTTFAAEEFASQSAAALEIRKAARRYPKFDPKTYPQFVGRYVVSSPEAMAGVTVVVTAGTDRLLAELSDGNVRELIPESSTRFSVWEPDRRGTFVTFLRDQAGKVTGFVADTTGGEISATKTK
jgi:hypothetical protein